jgi:NADP-dependent 3-hydroxy acid dehydrogenase YdfG
VTLAARSASEIGAAAQAISAAGATAEAETLDVSDSAALIGRVSDAPASADDFSKTGGPGS